MFLWMVCSMVDVELGRTFLPKQKLILETTKRFPFYAGGFGSGKTLLGCHKVIKECLENPRSVWLCASQTFPQCRDTVLVTFLQEVALIQKHFDDAGISMKLVKDYNKTELRITFYNGSVVLFRSCEDYSKFKSLTLSGFFLDEPVDVAQDVFNMLQGRLRDRHTKHHFGVLAGNPTNKSSWLFELYFKNPPSDDYLAVQTSTYDNTFLPDGYIKSMEESYDVDWTRRYLKGEWFNFEGLVYSEFDRSVHVGDYRGNVYNTYYGGFDFGFKNPSCLLIIAKDSDDNLIVLQELYQSGLTLTELGDRVGEMVKPFLGNFRKVFADPSMPIAIEEIKKHCRCEAGNNDVLNGITAVKSLFKTRKLFVDRCCVNLIRELESYQYEKDSRTKVFSESPVKRDDHAVDALRYAIAETSIRRKFVMPISKDW